MKPVLLTDFGSTYTKLTAVDLDAAKLLGTAQAYTTVASDVRIGFQKALDALLAQTGPLTFAQSYACSSAAGGLRMMVSGLVPELTMEAARLASLGAGAKIVGQFSFELTQDDLETIQRVNPDIFLLVGGTDGGNSACVIHNAQMLAAIRPQFPIVLAGNRTAMQQCRKALEGFEVSVCENVMPKFGVLKTEDTQKTIRSIFLRRIVQAKGLNAAAEQMSGPMMPTPAAVMQAMTLLAKGTDKTPGIGELIGGSQREEDYDKLVARMDELGLDKSSYDWYLNLRKFGGVEHAGYGLGFERMIMYLTGIQNIRDVLPFPRTAYGF